jgi:hypothetical protein
MIMLGSSDYTSLPHPTNEQFTQGLVDFINAILTDFASSLSKHVNLSLKPNYSHSAEVDHFRDAEKFSEQTSSSKILVMCAPGGLPKQCLNIQKATEITKTTYLRIPDFVYLGGFGCDAHPYKKTQLNMANYILPVVKELLNIS